MAFCYWVTEIKKRGSPVISVLKAEPIHLDVVLPFSLFKVEPIHFEVVLTFSLFKAEPIHFDVVLTFSLFKVEPIHFEVVLTFSLFKVEPIHFEVVLTFSLFKVEPIHFDVVLPFSLFSLVDGGGLRTFLCDPMHTLRSSGYTLSGIGFSRCAHPRKKKVVLATFLVVIHQTI